MNEKQLHEIAFVDANHQNLYYLCLALRLKVVDPDHFVVEKQEYRDRYKVSLGDQLFYIPVNDYNRFWLKLDKSISNAAAEIAESHWDYSLPVKHRQAIDLGTTEFAIDETDDFYSLMGFDFTDVEDRMTGLTKAAAQSIITTAQLINKEMEKVLLDTNIVKDFDAVITFRTEPGRNFGLEMCFDKIKPIDAGNDNIVIQRTPITEEDLKTYFPTTHEKITVQLNLVNSLVKAMFESKRIVKSEELTKYAEMLVNGVIVKQFLDQNINYIAFGGRDDWSSFGKETPNNQACFVYLDQEVDKIFKLLDSIPLQEGVEVWSIDLDTFAIFGRKDNKVVTPALQGYTADILKEYSQGFERVLTIRMSLIDSPHIFKA